MGRALLRTGYRLRIEGEEHVPSTGGVLVVANHVAFHDWLFVGVAMKRPPRFVMHQHHWQFPLLRAFFEKSRVIPIAPRKEDPNVLDRALRSIDEALANGELVVIFPEGTMTPNGQLSPFRPGLDRIVAKRQVPVVPVGISGLFGSFFSRARGAPMSGLPQRFRAPVTVKVGTPLLPADVSRAGLRALTDAARAAIARLSSPVPARAEGARTVAPIHEWAA
jgi:hypothetical protein